MPSLSSVAFAIDTLLACKGYQAKFISDEVPVSMETILSAAAKMHLPQVQGNAKGHLHYTQYSVLFHADRRVPFLSAYNIDGKKKATGIRRASGFKADPRIDVDIQLSQKGFYDLRKDITEFEIGHMAANDEMAWGDDAQLKAYQTFHFPNSVPQAERLNTGIWKSLEGYIIDEAIELKTNKKICVFTGPVLLKNDPKYVKDPKFQIPILFFKVIVFPTQSGLRSTAFVMSHEQRMIEQGMFVTDEIFEANESISHFEDFKYRKVFQVNIKMLETLTGMKFHWTKVKPVLVPDDINQIKKIRKIRDAQDAEDELEVFVKPGGQKVVLSEEELTPAEAKSKDFQLNMVLR